MKIKGRTSLTVGIRAVDRAPSLDVKLGGVAYLAVRRTALCLTDFFDGERLAFTIGDIDLMQIDWGCDILKAFGSPA